VGQFHGRGWVIRAGVGPRFVDYDGDDPLGLVISLNVQRRDMTAGQRALVAARVLIQLPERRGGDRRSPARQGKDQSAGSRHFDRKSRNDLAVIFKVGKESIQEARSLIEEAPDRAAQVEGGLFLKKAYVTLLVRREESRQQRRAQPLPRLPGRRGRAHVRHVRRRRPPGPGDLAQPPAPQHDAVQEGDLRGQGAAAVRGAGQEAAVRAWRHDTWSQEDHFRHW
jgi:hypothetical protein